MVRQKKAPLTEQDRARRRREFDELIARPQMTPDADDEQTPVPVDHEHAWRALKRPTPGAPAFKCMHCPATKENSQ